ncbi:hypothetical protein MDA_GLEAN10019339 [Myotis davidii]|uniref:Uncharacterized protein n=1 Tax=Myotis davidii TaxID=225400 RepID=L5LKM8_MYODS|nr:hypothetical protein MDA_GLEAN10019339 [Myotis davidii]
MGTSSAQKVAGLLSRWGSRQPAPRTETAQNQAELGKMAEPPGGKDLTSDRSPASCPFLLILPPPFSAPSPCFSKPGFSSFLIFLLKTHPQLGSSFPSKGVESR